MGESIPFLVPARPTLALRLRRRPPAGAAWAPLSSPHAYALFMGRGAIYHALRAVGLSPGQTVLVPSFHCASVVEPILRLGGKAVFYNVRKDCSPDLVDLAERVSADVRAVLAIHYFGFPQSIDALKAFCVQRGLFLIEDCAHVLHGTYQGRPLGTFGDVSIFSWRKFLPIHDGAHLLINNPTLHVDIPWASHSGALRWRVAKDLVGRLLERQRSATAVAMAASRAISRTLGSRRSTTHRSSTETGIDLNGVRFDETVAHLPMSRLSRHVVDHLDLAEVVRTRRSNYRALLERLRRVGSALPLFAELPADIAPLCLPVVVEGRDDLHLALRARGIPASTWGGVVHPQYRPGTFTDADLLFRQLVFLPVHQGMTPRDLDTVARFLEEVLGTR
jgi:dTDP-4-amino-4,6-dideoxygalactose transaminase